MNYSGVIVLAVLSIVSGVVAWFRMKHLRALPEPVSETPPEIIPPSPPIETNREKIYAVAKACFGKDIARTQDELGCAEAVSFVLEQAGVSNFKGFLGTTDLYLWLYVNFQVVTEPLPGDVIISPTGQGNGRIAHGHVGIVAKHGILSNNSMTGLFDEFFTLEMWRQRYQQVGGFPIIFFRWS